MIPAILASMWIIPAVSALFVGIVAGWFGNDWGLALIAAAGAGSAILAWRLLGWQAGLSVIAAAAALFTFRAGERRGATTQAAREKADADRAVQRANEARADADRRNADPRRLRDDDGFKRRD